MSSKLSKINRDVRRQKRKALHEEYVQLDKNRREAEAEREKKNET
jgi:hypothetical protein